MSNHKKKSLTKFQKEISEFENFIFDAYCGEFNDGVVRNYVTGYLHTLMRVKQQTYDIVTFNVVCDDTNNTPEVVDDGQLVFDIACIDSNSVRHCFHGVVE